MIILAIGGEPATGKSTLVQHIMKNFSNGQFHKAGALTYTHYPLSDIIVLGYYEIGNPFGGTDRLPMNVQPQAEIFIRSINNEMFKNTLVIFEGDRLFNGSFLEFLNKENDRNIFITLRSSKTAERHALRDNQNETWLKGRKTKIENIAKKFKVVERYSDEIGDIARIAAELFDRAEALKI